MFAKMHKIIYYPVQERYLPGRRRQLSMLRGKYLPKCRKKLLSSGDYILFWCSFKSSKPSSGEYPVIKTEDE